jgi:hypothetical protein
VAWLGCISEDVRLSTFDLSQGRSGVAAMGQDCNYQLDITKLGRKGEQKYIFIFYFIINLHTMPQNNKAKTGN